MRPAAPGSRWAALALAAACAVGGCSASGDGGTAPGGAPAEDLERAAMTCVAGAWVAETPALQAWFDAAVTQAGARQDIVVEGSLVYEFIEGGFGLTVLPTALAIRMPTPFGEVAGTITGHASGVWTVRGGEIHAAGDAWPSDLAIAWTFDGRPIDIPEGVSDMTAGFTDIDRFECSGDELVLQSPGAPALQLARMADAG